jgi:hypothetical protein
MIQEFLKKLSSKKDTIQSYQRLFASEDGIRVMKDLMKSCHFYDTTFTGDVYESAYKEGERSVILRIMRTIKLDPRDIDKILEGNQGETDGNTGIEF